MTARHPTEGSRTGHAPVLPSDLGGWAVFLDIDGTLIDLAETPDAVLVPPGLPRDVAALSARLDGALALVTGRSIAVVDRLLAPLRVPVAGLHGAERRDARGTVVKPMASPVLNQIKETLTAFAAPRPGVLIEDKGAAVAAHFRLAPHMAGEIERLMRGLAGDAGPDWTLQPGKMVLELRPAAADKGAAVANFLNDRPFQGRRPLVIGDDVTDESMFRIANGMGGCSVRVGPACLESVAMIELPSPASVRAWIAEMAA